MRKAYLLPFVDTPVKICFVNARDKKKTVICRISCLNQSEALLRFDPDDPVVRYRKRYDNCFWVRQRDIISICLVDTVKGGDC
jgi:hypothetical protein